MLRRVMEKYCTRVSKEGLQDKVHEVLRQSKLSSTVAEINTDGSTFFFFRGVMQLLPIDVSSYLI